MQPSVGLDGGAPPTKPAKRRAHWGVIGALLAICLVVALLGVLEWTMEHGALGVNVDASTAPATWKVYHDPLSARPLRRTTAARVVGAGRGG